MSIGHIGPIDPIDFARDATLQPPPSGGTVGAQGRTENPGLLAERRVEAKVQETT